MNELIQTLLLYRLPDYTTAFNKNWLQPSFLVFLFVKVAVWQPRAPYNKLFGQ